MLMLCDAYQIQKIKLKDLDPERAKLVGKSIAYIFDKEDDSVDPGAKLKRSWNWLKFPNTKFGKPLKYEEPQPWKLNLVYVQYELEKNITNGKIVCGWILRDNIWAEPGNAFVML